MRVLSIAPTRLSLFGGGSDVQPYCDEYGGITISMAISIRQKMLLLMGDEVFEVQKNSFPFKGDPEFCYNILKHYGLGSGHLSRIVSTFDGYLEGGLGSSAAAAVALIGAINKAKNLEMNAKAIAWKAWELEVEELGLFGGKQDQFASALGGVNVMQFTGGRVDVTPLARGFIEKIGECLYLFFTGQTRTDPKIQERMKELTPERVRALHHIKKIALDAVDPIANGDFKKVGAMLHESWEMKKESNPLVTTPRIDELYVLALKNGALGGKIMGSGGGGYMFFVCNPLKADRLISSLREAGCEWVDFSVDYNGLETRVVPFADL